MARFSFLLCLLASITAVSAALHDLIATKGKLFFGTATDPGFWNDTKYFNILNQPGEFGLVVPENDLKWEVTEPTQGQFVFTGADQILNNANKNRQLFRCHTLVWFQQLPNFVQSGNFTRESLTLVIQTHIANVVGHYRGDCYSWDVVNEALNDNGTFRDSVFFRVLGFDYIPIAFEAAEAADPNVKLYYNDFNIEFPGNKSSNALAIVKQLQLQNVRIDGVGFQGHFTVGQTPSAETLAGVLEEFTALGLEVAYTELDIRQPTLPPTDAMIQQQANDYISVVSACLLVERCVGVVVWEFTDKFSWVPSTFPGTGDACIRDSNFTERLAYTSVQTLLGGPPDTAPALAPLPPAPALPAAPAVGVQAATSSGLPLGLFQSRGWFRSSRRRMR